MLVVLQASIAGFLKGRAQLRSGQSIRVGSSGWNDLCISDDPQLRDAHFELSYSAEGCVVRTLVNDAPTLLNGEPVDTTLVFDGDEVQAGETRFSFFIEGGPERPGEASGKDDLDDAFAEPAAATLDLVTLCTHLEFSDACLPIAEAAESADELISDLYEANHVLEALRLRAYLLEKRQAVWWGCCGVRELIEAHLPQEQVDAVDAAANWVAQPDDAHRRAAEAKAIEARYDGVGAMLALASFWSGGSIGPESGFDNQPDERMLSQAIASALFTAAYLGDAEKVDERLGAFFKLGSDIADGEVELPHTSSS